MHRKTMVAVLALVAAATAGVSTASASTPESGEQGCQRGFDATIRTYVEAHPSRDLAAIERTLHDEDTVILPDATVYPGKAAAMEFWRTFFADRAWTQSFTPVRRVVSGCATGYVLMDSVYSKPDGYRSHLLIGLTLTREHGRWLVVLDQNTRIPAV